MRLALFAVATASLMIPSSSNAQIDISPSGITSTVTVGAFSSTVITLTNTSLTEPLDFIASAQAESCEIGIGHSLPWAAPNLVTGTIAAGGFQLITMTLGSGALLPGTYLGYLCVNVLDGVTGTAGVSLTLLVRDQNASSVPALSSAGLALFGLTLAAATLVLLRSRL